MRALLAEASEERNEAIYIAAIHTGLRKGELLGLKWSVGKPINPSNLYNRDYKPLLKRAGLEDERFTFHSLRHTFASALCNKRVYPKVIQSLLGHSSITQTMDTYSHLMGSMGGDAVDGLDEAFG